MLSSVKNRAARFVEIGLCLYSWGPSFEMLQEIGNVYWICLKKVWWKLTAMKGCLGLELSSFAISYYNIIIRQYTEARQIYSSFPTKTKT